MKHAARDLLACSLCHECLDNAGIDKEKLRAGPLICSHCKRDYLIVEGVPYFVVCRA